MANFTTPQILSVVSSLISKEEMGIFTQALNDGAIYTGNSLGQILESLMTGKELVDINDFDLFLWLQEEEAKQFDYTDYRGDVYRSVPSTYEVHMGAPVFTGRVSLVKVHSFGAVDSKGYFSRYPMANWVDCWMTKDELYIGDSFLEFIKGAPIALNRGNAYLSTAIPKFLKKVSQGYNPGVYLYRANNEVYSNLGEGLHEIFKYAPHHIGDFRELISLAESFLAADGSCLMWEIGEWWQCVLSLRDKSPAIMEAYQYLALKWAKVEDLKVDHKWLRHEYQYQQAIKLLVAQYGGKLKACLKITPDEWKSGKLTKSTMLYLGVFKGSPKVSKVLMGMGVPEKVVSMTLSAGKVAPSKNKETATTIRGDAQSCREQGNSVYYSSCQATDSRANWSSGKSYNQIKGDLEFIGKTLFLWTIGSPMSVDGKGFVCRAKLRVIFKPTGELLGLFIDRIYGSQDLLMEYSHELEDWWNDHCLTNYGVQTPVFNLEAWDKKNPKVSFMSPSSARGYQDKLNLNNNERLVEVSSKRKSLLYLAYTSRGKDEVYTKPIKEVRYNPQNGSFS